MRPDPLLPVLVVASAVALNPTPAAALIRPGTLLVYYGWPTSINHSYSVTTAALEFGRYDHVVWGDGLDNPAHPDYSNAVAILAHAATARTRFYGYVDVGVSTQNLPMSEVQARVARWQAMGVEGVLFDDFGYEFGTTRERQNAAVDYAHALGLTVIVNASRPADAFDPVPVPVHNPGGLATHVGTADFYLYESHGVRLGEYEDAEDWQAKADALQAYGLSLGFKVLSITTTATDDVGAYDESGFFYAWHAALLFGHEATGWGEFAYSAKGASNGQAPFRARPLLEPGVAFVTPVVHAGSSHTRQTDLGHIHVDTADHSFGFTPAVLGVSTPTGSGGMSLAAAPNPVRNGTSLEFYLAREQAVRLAMRDVNGRHVAMLVEETLPAGRHRREWGGLDEAGQRVPAGVYFATLEIAGARRVVRLVVLR